MTDKEYMQIAIDISKTESYPYGAIIVKNDKIVGRSDAVVKKMVIDYILTLNIEQYKMQ